MVTRLKELKYNPLKLWVVLSQLSLNQLFFLHSLFNGSSAGLKTPPLLIWSRLTGLFRFVKYKIPLDVLFRTSYTISCIILVRYPRSSILSDTALLFFSIKKMRRIYPADQSRSSRLKNIRLHVIPVTHDDLVRLIPFAGLYKKP